MRALSLSLLAGATAVLSGCVTLEQASSSISCMLSSGPGCPGTTTTAPAGAGQSDRFTQLQFALDEEIQQARNSQAAALTAMQSLRPGLRAVAGPVQLLNVDITDSQSGRTRKLRTLDSVTVDMPLAAKGQGAYTQAMDSLKDLANRLADNRGTSSIIVDQSEADVRARRVNTATGVTQTSRGKPVSVQKNIDRSLPPGMERYTIKAGEIRGQL